MKVRARAKRKAVFVDRDGTLNEMVYDDTHGTMDSPRRPGQVRMASGAGAFLRGLRKAGFFICVVTNQPAVAKGTLTLAELDAVNRELESQLAADGGMWDELRYCLHHPGDGRTTRGKYIRRCACRKPKPGMLVASARENGLDLASSWMVGDGMNDIEAGRAAGCRTVLVAKVKVEHLVKFFGKGGARPTAIAPGLRRALKIIVGRR